MTGKPAATTDLRAAITARINADAFAIVEDYNLARIEAKLAAQGIADVEALDEAQFEAILYGCDVGGYARTMKPAEAKLLRDQQWGQRPSGSAAGAEPEGQDL